tara:strand:+ start:300 stop:647 length:348 start_codon:yes stop_codon:yes gene_type:complete
LPATFPRAARLLNAEQFTNVFQRGYFAHRNSGVRVRVLENSGNAPRIGVIVPKRGNRLAVRRNRIKRLVRDHFRIARGHLKNVDIIVHVTSAVTDEDLIRILGQSVNSLKENKTC